MTYFPVFMPTVTPVFVPVKDRLCVVVGGGEMAFREVERLLSAGAHVGVVAPCLVHPLSTLADEGKISWRRGSFNKDDLGECALVLAASGEAAFDSKVVEQAMEAGIPAGSAMSSEESRTEVLPLVRGEAGRVAVVGAGPGNPELLTLRAFHLLRTAEVVLYDNLVDPVIISLIPASAERIFVGKVAGHHTLVQEEINALLVAHARQGRRVVRLKGGDPFIFGRGGEEIETLVEEGVPFEIVPGITSASGASAYAGIPLTHRDYAQSCVFVTGHRREGEKPLDLDWASLASPDQTVVVYMGLGQAGAIADQLIRHGRSSQTPVAVIERATTPCQRTLVATLADVQQAIVRETMQSPSLLIIGEVVGLHRKLGWWEKFSAEKTG